MKTQPNDPISQVLHKDGSPLTNSRQHKNSGVLVGLTKREYFMSLAIQGLCANSNYSPNEIKNGACVDIAEAAIYIVDAAINALNDNP